MKIKRFTLLLVIITGLFVSCDDLKFGEAFLDKPLGNTITIDTVFGNKKYADQALNQVYKTLPDYNFDLVYHSAGVGLDAISDICFAPGTFYYNGTLSADWTPAFPFRLDHKELIGNPLKGFRMAYIYLGNVDNVPDMTIEEKKLRKAEAKAIIAFHYAFLIRYYGGLPWIDHAYQPDETFKFSRMTLAETVAKTVALLDEAANDLPWSAEPEDFGRMTAAACKAIKFRTLLFVASPLFNNEQPYFAGAAADNKLSWFGNYSEERWKAALDAGLDFMRLNQANSTYYQMVNTGNPRQDFIDGYFTKGTHEVILSSHRWAVYNRTNKGFDRGYAIVSQAPRASYADMFQWKDGTEFDWNNPIHAANPFFDKNMNPTRDIRLYETLLVNQDKYQNRKAEAYMNGREGPNSKVSNFGMSGLYGYAPRKFLRDKLNEMNGKPYQCPLFRMPEIYLSLAEAMNQLGLASVKDEFGNTAYDYVALVRARAGMPRIDNIQPGTNLLNAILRERALEFGYEECRYYDIIRWKRGNDLFRTPLQKLEITLNSNGTFSYKSITLDAMRYFWKDNWYLLPFATSEIQKNYGLIQNPGW